MTRKTTRLIIAMQEVRDAMFQSFMDAVEDEIGAQGLPELGQNPLDPIDGVVSEAVTDLETLDAEDDPAEAVEKAVARVVEVWRQAYGDGMGKGH